MMVVDGRGVGQSARVSRFERDPASSQIRIDLTLPSASVIELNGTVEQHVSDQRGSGVELRLAPVADGSIWLIESALASEQRRTTPPRGVPTIPLPPTTSGPIALVALRQVDDRSRGDCNAQHEEQRRDPKGRLAREPQCVCRALFLVCHCRAATPATYKQSGNGQPDGPERTVKVSPFDDGLK